MSAELRSELGSDWIWPRDQYHPASTRDALRLREIFHFEAPHYSYLVQRGAYLANWLLQLRLGRTHHGTVMPIIRDSDIVALQSIRRGAGNILVGPHPGPVDPQLIFHLLSKVHNGPAVFLMAAQSYYEGGQLRRWLLNRLGVIPVARGRKNPEAIKCMTGYLAKGWWGGIFPEGEVYFSREVMPMEYGAVRIAVEAALRCQRRAHQPSRRHTACRPVYITPFAHVYLFRDPTTSKRRAEAALREIEAHPKVSIREPLGGMPTRLRSAADRLLAGKAEEYGIPGSDWLCSDRFERVHNLQDAVLGRLEQRYIGNCRKGYARRRAMEVRMACFERLTNDQLSAEERNSISKDVQKTRELILMAPFTRDYREKYGDLEMWIEYLRRLRSALGLAPFDFGPQEVVFKILTPIDMHPIAAEYRSLASEEHRKNLLFGMTETLREAIQAGVDEICDAHPTIRIPDPET